VHILENVELKDYTSLRAGGLAERLIVIEPGDNLREAIERQKGEQVWVLGFGTNCLISDKGLPGTVVINKTGQITEVSDGRFKIDTGVNWDDFIQRLIGLNLWGLEFTSGIPGGTGAAIAGNIAAYGHKVADSFVEATVLDVKTGSIEVSQKDSFGFDYRTSNLQLSEYQSKVVLDATFQLSPEPKNELEYESALKVAREIGIAPDSLENRRKIIMETRRRASSLLIDLDSGPWTAGSFFKNPLVDESQIQTIVEHEENSVSREQLLRQNQIHGQDKARVSAALVLLAAGFQRGQSWGHVRLNPEHILKIENTGGASAAEIYAVAQEIISTVKSRMGIELQPEVRFLGDY